MWTIIVHDVAWIGAMYFAGSIPDVVSNMAEFVTPYMNQVRSTNREND